VLPVLTADGASLTLDVSLALARPCSVENHVFLKNENAHELNVQLRSAGMQTLCSKVRLGREQAVLLALPPANVGEKAPADVVFLLIRPAVR